MLRGFAGVVAAILVASATLVGSSPLPAGRAGPVGPEEGPFRKQLWLVPSGVPDVLMRTTLFRPAGQGPFRLVVINHGTTANADDRAALPRPEFEALSAWFVRADYAVAVPQRPGHGETGGPYLEDIGSCGNPDFRRAGLGAAASILAAMKYLTAQSFIRKRGTVLAGQSAGSWGALAAASVAPPALGAVINFAGGLGGHSYGKPNRNCAPDELVATAAAFGKTATVPTTWIYAANDTYFEPGLSSRMAAAFRAAGGRAEYHLTPPAGEEGHFLVFAPQARHMWEPIIEKFLKSVSQ